MKGPRRTDRVAPTIQSAVERVLARGLSDPRIRGLITVTKVTVDDALKNAIVDVSVYPAEHSELTMHGLNAASAHIRHEISDQLALRRTPHLRFRLDESLKRQAEVFNALGRANAEREARDPSPAEPPSDHAPTADPASAETTTDPTDGESRS